MLNLEISHHLKRMLNYTSMIRCKLHLGTFGALVHRLNFSYALANFKFVNSCVGICHQIDIRSVIAFGDHMINLSFLIRL